MRKFIVGQKLGKFDVDIDADSPFFDELEALQPVLKGSVRQTYSLTQKDISQKAMSVDASGQLYEGELLVDVHKTKTGTLSDDDVRHLKGMYDRMYPRAKIKVVSIIDKCSISCFGEEIVTERSRGRTSPVILAKWVIKPPDRLPCIDPNADPHHEASSLPP